MDYTKKSLLILYYIQANYVINITKYYKNMHVLT